MWEKAFGGTEHRYDEIIKTHFRETERIKEMDWIGVAEWSTDGLLRAR